MLTKQVKFFLLAASLVTSASVFAADLSDDMDTLAKNYGIFTKTTTAAEAVNALDQMHKAATDAKSGTPDKLYGEPADSPSMKEYRAGLDTLIAEIDKAKTFAQDGKLDQAKASVAKMADIRNANHHKFR